MPPTRQELSLLINPVVPEAVTHNKRTLSALHSLTAFLLGVSAGVLGLQSSHGFAFYIVGTLFVSLLFHGILVGFQGSSAAAEAARKNTGAVGGADAYFPGTGELVDGERKGAWRDVWFAGGVVGEGLSGFVLGWAGVGGFLR